MDQVHRNDSLDIFQIYLDDVRVGLLAERQGEHAYRIQGVLFEGQRASLVQSRSDSSDDPQRVLSETVQRRRDVHRAQVLGRVPSQIRIGVP